MDYRAEHYRKTAEVIIGNMKKRNFHGIYCPDRASALKTVLELIPQGSSVSWGGSLTMSEIGVMDALRGGDYVLLDRAAAPNSQERRAIYAEIQNADYFLLSANAVTMDGELVNVDGRSDRVSFFCFGPRHVIVVAGMNKVVDSAEDGVKRVRRLAAPMNAAKNGRNTPCIRDGVCHNCFSDECVCSNILISRRSSAKDRITVILVGEELGL